MYIWASDFPDHPSWLHMVDLPAAEQVSQHNLQRLRGSGGYAPWDSNPQPAD